MEAQDEHIMHREIVETDFPAPDPGNT